MKQKFPLKNKHKEIKKNNHTFFEAINQDIILKVKIVPNSSVNTFLGVMKDRLKIAISAPPLEGKANKKCIDFLARYFKVPKSRVEIISGLKSKEKQIKIYHLKEEIFLEKISKII